MSPSTDDGAAGCFCVRLSKGPEKNRFIVWSSREDMRNSRRGRRRVDGYAMASTSLNPFAGVGVDDFDESVDSYWRIGRWSIRLGLSLLGGRISPAPVTRRSGKSSFPLAQAIAPNRWCSSLSPRLRAGLCGFIWVIILDVFRVIFVPAHLNELDHVFSRVLIAFVLVYRNPYGRQFLILSNREFDH